MLGITPEKNFYNQASIVASHVLQMQNYVEDVNPMTQDEKDMYNRFEDERNIPLDFFNDEYGEAPFAKEISDVQLNLQNLELTNEVIDYLYNVSSQRLSRESYGKEAYKLVTNLKGSLTNEEVVEKLKCL